MRGYIYLLLVGGFHPVGGGYIYLLLVGGFHPVGGLHLPVVGRWFSPCGGGGATFSCCW